MTDVGEIRRGGREQKILDVSRDCGQEEKSPDASKSVDKSRKFSDVSKAVFFQSMAAVVIHEAMNMLPSSTGIIFPSLKLCREHKEYILLFPPLAPNTKI